MGAYSAGAIGVWAFDTIARPLLAFYGKTAAFDALTSATGTWAILTMLITSGLTHIPPMKVVTILSGVVAFDLKLFILSAIVARGGRFYLLAFLLRRYGLRITAFVETPVALGCPCRGAAGAGGLCRRRGVLMTLSRTLLILLAAGGSAAILAGAFAFQYIGGLAPCQLCLWQRWPHAAAIGIGVLALLLPTGVMRALLPRLGALAALATAGIGVFHVGVEQKWWEGLASCTAGTIEGLSAQELLDPTLDVGAVVRCDEIAWALGGISMAGWNVILSVGFVALWLLAARRPT